MRFPHLTARQVTTYLRQGAIYLLLSVVAYFVLFPFLFMLFTSLKAPTDVFNYPPRLLPYEQAIIDFQGAPRELYYLPVEGREKPFALVEEGIEVGIFVDPMNPSIQAERMMEGMEPSGKEILASGEDVLIYDIEVEGEVVPMILQSQSTLGRFVELENPRVQELQNVRLSKPVERLTAHPENYQEVLALRGLARSLTNTILVTILVVVGTVTTSVLGGYAFARLRFPGRDRLFLLYLGTLMIPFVVLILPMYQLMVLIGWVDTLASLIIPWIFSAYGTFLMRQFFLSIPKELEEAALIDGASRLTILWRIIVPMSMPAIATQATFTFLYAWNSFFWPLVIINTGNTDNHVLTLALNVLQGRAAESPNLVMAGAAIAVLPPMLVFVFAQRYFVEGVANSGLKG